MTSWPLPPTPGGEHTTLGDLMGISVSLMPRLAAGGGGALLGKQPRPGTHQSLTCEVLSNLVTSVGFSVPMSAVGGVHPCHCST